VIDIGDLGGAVDHRDVFLGSAQKRDNRSLCTCVSRVVASGSSVRPVVSLVVP
jgi:vanillate O-demethylase ferredoxin subunit